MKGFVKLAALGVLVASLGSTAGAQEMQHKAWIGAPIFLAQPGVVTANAINKQPAGSKSLSGLNVRFATVIPTATPYFNLVAGVQFQPNGLNGNKANSPGFFYGGIIPIALIGQFTQNWLSVSVDPLGVYGGNPIQTAAQRARGQYPYSHEFYLEGAFVLNVGAKMMASMGAWSGLGAYFLVDQQITHTKDAAGNTHYWHPVLLYGLSLPIAPWK
jgi:hypothetical protein